MTQSLDGYGWLRCDDDNLGFVEFKLLVDDIGNTISGRGSVHGGRKTLEVAHNLGTVSLHRADCLEGIVLRVLSMTDHGMISVSVGGYE